MLTYRRVISETPSDYTVETNACPDCGTTEQIILPAKGIVRYNNGAMIQDAFPNLTSAQRERFLSGYCDPCYEKMFDNVDDYYDS